jgi:hypothetical protein
MHKAVQPRYAYYLIFTLSLVFACVTAYNLVATQYQVVRQTFDTKDGSITISATRTQFVPEVCTSVTWESEELEQVLRNGQVVDNAGSLEDCGITDRIQSFLIVSEGFTEAKYVHIRIGGISSLILLLIGLAGAGILTANKISVIKFNFGPWTPVIHWVFAIVGVMALLQSLYPFILQDSLFAWLTYWLYLTLGVILPGTLLVIMFTKWNTDILTWIGLGWTVGHGMELVGLYVGKILGIPHLFLVWIAVVYIFAIVKRTALTDRFSRPSLWVLPALSLVFLISGGMFLSLNLPEMSPRPPYISDVWFHVSNAHEFRDHLVPQDPRIAGEPFNYHMFGYAPTAAASLVTGTPVANLLTRYAGMSSVFLLGLLLFNAGRIVAGGRVAAGVVSALLVLAPLDLLSLFSLSLSPSTSLLYFGVYVSTTTISGHIYLAALFLPLLWYYQQPRLENGWVIVLFAVCGAGSKSMFGPLLVCGVAGEFAWGLIRRRFDRNALILLCLVSLPVALITLQLVFGAGSYAESIEWIYAEFSEYTRFYEAVSADLGDFLSRTMWLIVFAILFLVGTLSFIWSRRAQIINDRYAVFIIMVFLASVIPSMGIALQGASQLFFLYYGLTALASLAGFGYLALFTHLVRQRYLLVSLFLSILILYSIAQFRFVPPNLGFNESVMPVIAVFTRTTNWFPVAFQRHENLPLATGFEVEKGPYLSRLNMSSELRRGLEWARLNLPDDAVFIVNVSNASLYGALSEHRAFFETDMFSSRAHVAGGESDYYEERRSLLADWQAGVPNALENLAMMGVTHIYVDFLNGFPVVNESPARLLFQNDHFAVVALQE